jgi:hypothetical protein
MNTSPRREMELTDDGELREVHEQMTPEERLSSIYCTDCGTANRASSRFCRNCGASLDDQQLEQDYPMSGPKMKRGTARQIAPANQSSSSGLAVEAITALFMMMIIVSGSFATHSSIIAIAALVTWVLIVAARHGAFTSKR